MDTIKGAMVQLGLGTPTNRFVATTAISALAEYAIKPSFAFLPSGEIRPWAITSPSENSTLLHFGMVPLTLGFCAAFFI